MGVWAGHPSEVKARRGPQVPVAPTCVWLQPACVCVYGSSFLSPLPPCPAEECVLYPALVTASFPLPFPLALSLSVSVFLFSRKSVRGKGKGQKRKRKKSRYKSWSAYVVPLLSHCLEPPWPPSKLPPAGPRNPASLPPALPGSPSSRPQCLSLTLTPLIGTMGRFGGGVAGPGPGWAGG